MAIQVGIHQTTVARIWRAHGPKPHVVETIKVSTDPDFVAKLRDVVGLYLDPPKRAGRLLGGSEESDSAFVAQGAVASDNVRRSRTSAGLRRGDCVT